MSSEDQFQELLARLTAHLNQVLHQTDQVPTLALAMQLDGKVELSIAGNDKDGAADDPIALLQQSLQEKAERKIIVATCICLADYGADCFVAYLENNESYCLKAILPVITNAQGQHSIDVAGVETDEGQFLVFPPE